MQAKLVLWARDELRASKVMQQRAEANEKIDIVWNSELKRLVGQNIIFIKTS